MTKILININKLIMEKRIQKESDIYNQRNVVNNANNEDVGKGNEGNNNSIIVNNEGISQIISAIRNSNAILLNSIKRGNTLLLEQIKKGNTSLIQSIEAKNSRIITAIGSGNKIINGNLSAMLSNNSRLIQSLININREMLLLLNEIKIPEARIR